MTARFLSAARGFVLAGLLVWLSAVLGDDAGPVHAPTVAVGDTWTYTVIRSDGRPSTTTRTEIVRIEHGAVIVRRGAVEVTYAEPWIMTRSSRDGRSMSIRPGFETVPFPLVVGASRVQRLQVMDETNGSKRTDEARTTVRGWENVEVPAGKFRAMRIDLEEVNGVGTASPERRRGTYWYSPALRSHVQVESIDPRGTRIVSKLQSFTLH